MILIYLISGKHYSANEIPSSSSSSSMEPLRVMARAGKNISLACPGVVPSTYIYLVEWKCLGCDCRDCPNPNGEGSR